MHNRLTDNITLLNSAKQEWAYNDDKRTCIKHNIMHDV